MTTKEGFKTRLFPPNKQEVQMWINNHCYYMFHVLRTDPACFFFFCFNDLTSCWLSRGACKLETHSFTLIYFHSNHSSAHASTREPF